MTLFGRERLVLDGAMGTQLIERGLQHGEPSVVWNRSRRHDVIAVHQAYVEAGSNCITTNTFGGSSFMLAKHGLEGDLETLNQAAVACAKEASGGKCLLLGDIGPCGDFLEPLGDLTEDELSSQVLRQATVLLHAGVDGFIVETMSDLGEMVVTIKAVKTLGLPVLASFTYEKRTAGYCTMMGIDPLAASIGAIKAGADAVGANCGTSLSLDDYLQIGGMIVDVVGDVPVLLQPNAGMPVTTESGFAYDLQPEAFAEWAKEAKRLGVRVLGGCCGTTPSLIACLASL